MFALRVFIFLDISDLGRTASHFYIKYATVEVFNDNMEEIMTEADVLSMMSLSQEFEQLKVGNYIYH
jgi:activating signal cointegrator complex subunit 3